MYSLHLTHPKWTHTWSSGQPCYSAREAVGGSVPCSRTPQSWYWRRILPPPTIPAGPETNVTTVTWDTGTSTASLDTYGENSFFSDDWSLYNHGVKLHGHWFVQWIKNEPMARQWSCTNLWRGRPPEPARRGGVIWLYKPNVQVIEPDECGWRGPAGHRTNFCYEHTARPHR